MSVIDHMSREELMQVQASARVYQERADNALQPWDIRAPAPVLGTRVCRHVANVPSRDIRTFELAHRATGLVGFSKQVPSEFHGFCMNRITLSARASWRRFLVPCSLNSFRCKAAQRL